MKWLTLEYIHAHSRIESDCEDGILQMYGESAEDTVLNILHRTYEDLIEQYGKVPTPVVHASLMLVDISYQHRAPITPANISLVPYSFDMLLKPYMRLT